jgi:ribosomal-protein-alanine N-acetyltransferase
MRLTTARLELEPLAGDHAERLWEGLRDERLYEFLDEEPPVSLAALRERYEVLARGRSRDGREIWLNWAVRVRDLDRYAGYVQATVTPPDVASIAYVLFPEFWGKGYAREAVEAMNAHLAAHYGARDLRATVDVRNARSIALLERLGFSRSATGPGPGLTADEAEYRHS